MGTREIARELDIAPSTAFRLLKAALSEGFVEQSDEGDYTLTAKILQVASRMLRTMQLPEISKEYLEELSHSAECTAFLAVAQHQEIIYVLQVQSRTFLQLNVETGTRRPMYCTGLGKAILAFLPENIRSDVLLGPLPKVTEQTITDPHALRTELEIVRNVGFAIDNEEIIQGIKCIAAPVFNWEGRVVAAVSIAGIKEKFNDEFVREFSVKVIHTAQMISHHLGSRSEEAPAPR